MTINDAMTIKGLMGVTVHRLYLNVGSGFGTQVLVDLDNNTEFLDTFGDNSVSAVNVSGIRDENGLPDGYIVRIIVDELMS